MCAARNHLFVLVGVVSMAVSGCQKTTDQPSLPRRKADGPIAGIYDPGQVKVSKLELLEKAGYKRIGELNPHDLFDETLVDVRAPCWVEDAVKVLTIRDVQASLRGASSRHKPKKSYSLKFEKCKVVGSACVPDDDGKYPKLDVFAAGYTKKSGIEKLALNGSWIDPTFINNKLTFDIIRELGGLAPRVDYAEVSINGSLHGFYQLIESVNERFLQRRGLDVDNAYLIKATQHSLWYEHELVRVEAKFKPDGRFDEYHFIKSYPYGEESAFESKLGSQERTEGVFRAFLQAAQRVRDDSSEPLVHYGDFSVMHAVRSMANDIDGMTKNYYLYLPNGQLPARLIAWDADATWGRHWDGPRQGNSDAPMSPLIWGAPNATAHKWLDRDAGGQRNGTKYFADYRYLLTLGALRAEWLRWRVEKIAEKIGPYARIDAAGAWAAGVRCASATQPGCEKRGADANFNEATNHLLAWIKQQHWSVSEKVNGECGRFGCANAGPSAILTQIESPVGFPSCKWMGDETTEPEPAPEPAPAPQPLPEPGCGITCCEMMLSMPGDQDNFCNLQPAAKCVGSTLRNDACVANSSLWERGYYEYQARCLGDRGSQQWIDQHPL